MKQLFLSIVLIFSGIICRSQAYDANWLIGNGGVTGYNNCMVHFDSISATSYLVNRSIPISLTNACISDPQSNLLFFTNGLDLFDSTLNPIAGGQLIQNQYTLQYQGFGLNQPQQTIFVPYPGDSNKFVLFYTTKEYLMPLGSPGWIPYELPLHLYYTVLDKSLNGGLGGVVSANNIALNDTLSQFGSGLAAVKHANGRDWWIIVKKHYKNIHHKFLLTPSGVSYQGSQAIGPNNQYYYVTTSNFSPDGNIYGQSRGYYDIFLFHFDRCNGMLSDFLHLLALDPSGLYGCESINFSSNSRYLYASTVHNITQFDLQNYSINPVAVQNSAIVVAYADSDTTTCAPGNFPIYYALTGRLAPNNKIYIPSNYSCDHLTTIEEPDSAGLGCNVQGGNFQIASPNTSSFPFFTNYKLGPVVGSVCDSITSIKDELAAGNFIIYPNPARDYIKIKLTNDYFNFSVKLYSIQGRLIQEQVFSYGHEFTLQFKEKLSPGIYLLEVESKEGKAMKKLVVQ